MLLLFFLLLVNYNMLLLKSQTEVCNRGVIVSVFLVFSFFPEMCCERYPYCLGIQSEEKKKQILHIPSNTSLRFKHLRQ